MAVTSRLISVPAQNSAVYTERTADISSYLGKQARLVVLYQSGSSFTGDVQLDDFSIGGNFYDPEDGANGFQVQSTADNSQIASGNLDNIQTDYDAVSWTTIGTTTTDYGKFIRDSGGTPSGSTGLTTGNTGNFYYYAETSSTGSLNDIWLRSPQVTIKNDDLSFFTAQYGATSGAIYAYLDAGTDEVEYSATSMDHLNRWGTLDSLDSFGTLDSIVQFDVFQAELSASIAVTATSSIGFLLDVAGTADVAITGQVSDADVVTTIAGTADIAATASASCGVIRHASASVTGAGSVTATCLIVRNFGGAVSLSATATCSGTLFKVMSATANLAVTVTATNNFVLGLAGTADMAVTATSTPAGTFVVSSAVDATLSATSTAKILGEDWSGETIGSEVWTDVTVGSEVWTQVQTGTETWARQ